MDATANCADPAKVVADMTVAARASMPADPASTPNEMPKVTAATAIGAIARAPSR